LDLVSPPGPPPPHTHGSRQGPQRTQHTASTAGLTRVLLRNTWLRLALQPKGTTGDDAMRHGLVEGSTTRDKQSVSGARTLRSGTQTVQALSGRARSNTVGEGRNSRRRYSCYTAISVPAVTICSPPQGTPSPNTAADTAHSAHSTQPALRPHRATPRVEDKTPANAPAPLNRSMLALFGGPRPRVSAKARERWFESFSRGGGQFL